MQTQNPLGDTFRVVLLYGIIFYCLSGEEALQNINLTRKLLVTLICYQDWCMPGLGWTFKGEVEMLGCRTALLEALQRMGLRNFFTALVTAEDGMDTTSQRFLSSAIKLGRPPMDCVVFESNPVGITAAHNCSCKVKS